MAAHNRPLRRPTVAALATVVVTGLAVAGTGLGARLTHRPPPVEEVGLSPVVPTPAPAPSCLATTTGGRLHMDPAQAAGASTIAAVGKELGLGDPAVTVALVASLQESKLRNVPSGDLDSIGLFQQRPSQGWGTPAQLIDPAYAARAFYAALVRIPGWEAMPPGDVAQRVQRSAAPEEYRVWEHQARMLTEAFTGQAGAAVSCRFDTPAALAPSAQPLDRAVATELGEPALGVEVAITRGWTVAGWLVGHAYEYGITAVSFLGQTWNAATGTWQDQPNPAPVVQVVRTS